MSTTGDLPAIHETECTGCADCIPACPAGALTMVDNVVALVPNVDCNYCGECEAVCPTEAITCPYEVVIEGE